MSLSERSGLEESAALDFTDAALKRIEDGVPLARSLHIRHRLSRMHQVERFVALIGAVINPSRQVLPVLSYQGTHAPTVLPSRVAR